MGLQRTGAAVAVAWEPSQKPLGLLVLPHPHIFLAGESGTGGEWQGGGQRVKLKREQRTVAAVAVACRVGGLAASALAGLGHDHGAADWGRQKRNSALHRRHVLPTRHALLARDAWYRGIAVRVRERSMVAIPAWGGGAGV